ncbi:hypothetical protein KUCAC02_019642, partial [Chaenocephalus aceratus]
MMRAGLGKRCALIPEDADHSEICAIFEMEFPKLESLNGDWLFYKNAESDEFGDTDTDEVLLVSSSKETVVERATEVFRRTLLGQREEMAPLRLSIDIREDVDKQEMAIISFYKSRQTKWSRPLRWTSEGDVAMEMLDGESQLSESDRQDVTALALTRDLPGVAVDNRKWLFYRMLQMATVLDHIEWPLELLSDDEGEYSMTVKSQVAEYLRQFIENASPTRLRQLVTSG